jgi:hypothetical protein
MTKPCRRVEDLNQRLKVNLDGRLGSLVSNTTHVLTTDHANVTRFTPRGTPRVLNVPVRSSRVGTSTYNENTVVELLTTESGVKDTTGVHLEYRLVSFDSNRYRSELKSSQKSIFGTGLYVIVSRESSNIRAGSFAVTVYTSVWVVRFSADSSVLNDEFESRVHEATVAAHVTVRTSTVYELLFRERNEVVGRDKVSTFGRTGGTKCPTRTTLSLVLNSSYSTARYPIDRVIGREIGSSDGVGGTSANSFSIGVQTETGRSKFFPGLISESVQASGESRFTSVELGVVSVHNVKVGLKHSVTVEGLVMSVGLLVLLYVVSEVLLVLWYSRSKEARERIVKIKPNK